MKQRFGIMKLIAQNRKARHDYAILDTFEAGIELVGSEVKSVKAGEISLAEAYVSVRRGEAWLVGAYVKPYQASQGAQPEPNRDRKLLLHKTEVAKLIGAAKEKTQTIIPLNVHLKRGLVKLDIALGRSKKQYDKRATLKERDAKREAERAIRDRDKS